MSEADVDVPDFPTALRAALRQASDVIGGGEMRDPETMQIAVALGETGHLVSDKQWPRLMTLRKSEATFRREDGRQCVAARHYSLLSRGTLILPESSRSSVKGRAHYIAARPNFPSSGIPMEGL